MLTNPVRSSRSTRSAAVSADATKRRTRRRAADTGFWAMAHSVGKMSESDRISTIKAGHSVAMADAVRETFNMDMRSLVELLNVSTATYERRRTADKPLDITASERLDRVATVALQAESVFEDSAAAAKWMSTPHQALNGNSPVMNCETAIGAKQVMRILHALEWGGVA
ncbi:type II toxin-antitoxin system Xre/ParS family antitoxin [Paenalcaligenes suwonensis]|uniref:type II RES/Xre toxin-antitoxin system antitoxin n=1 Tax=Paenalcaligenes suwonensis TaxID=1202713 RepID=UPI001F611802|nr:antitoxin Xre/MbcA/ParS toxin-binding domain-containing protein [Paenalcaligenes suwonensis]